MGAMLLARTRNARHPVGAPHGRDALFADPEAAPATP